jgi:23S rRNA pseudouridine1911/1915/1917 synthase
MRFPFTKCLSGTAIGSSRPGSACSAGGRRGFIALLKIAILECYRMTFAFTADRGDTRLRLDQVLVRRVTGVSRLSRTVAQQWIERGAVTIEGLVARRASAHVREGATVEVMLPRETVLRARPEAERGDLQVVYEDEHLLVVDKPPGIVVHPSYKQLGGTLLNTVLWRMRDRPGLRPGILTRLDKDTSGLVVIALAPDVHATMQRDAAAGAIRKEYLAVVAGVPRPRSGRIREPLARDPTDRRRVVVTPGGADSETIYELTETCQSRGSGLSAPRPLSLVRCELVTGRTHQIRVHLAFKGWPIVGDRLYGTPDDRIARQALHAWRVTFAHPVTREPLELRTGLPEDMASLAGRR